LAGSAGGRAGQLPGGPEWDGPTGDDEAKRLRLGGALREFWWVQAKPGEGRHWLERALRAAPDAPAAARATALLGAGLLAVEQGDIASAPAFFRQSQALCEELGDRRGVAEALVGLGEIAVVQGRYEQARPLLEQAVREARAAGSQHLAALALNFVGNGLYLQGDWTAARPMYEQALERFRSIGYPHGVAVVTVQIGLCALEGGDQHEARSLVREGLQLAASWSSGGGSRMGLMGRPCWPPGGGAGRWPRRCWARPRGRARQTRHRSWVSARPGSLA
jgi:tetratricopeptide (TPR) repeat protein